TPSRRQPDPAPPARPARVSGAPPPGAPSPPSASSAPARTATAAGTPSLTIPSAARRLHRGRRLLQRPVRRTQLGGAAALIVLVGCLLVVLSVRARGPSSRAPAPVGDAGSA